MKEIKAIISVYDKIDKATVRAALATVVRVEGSSYRRTGARMLVMDDGTWVGGISGGCLEGDALKRARSAIAKSTASLITYDTTEDDAHQIGVGLGCNGIIDVLFTPLDYQDKNNPVEILKSYVMQDNRQTHVLLTAIALEGKWDKIKEGEAIQYKEPKDLKIFGNTGLENQLEEKINQQIETNKSAPNHFEIADGKSLSVFIELLFPQIHLILMGHQYDVYPLARLIKEIGWRATIVSNPLKVNTKITATVDKVYGDEQFKEILIDRYTAILLMSHDYKTDKINLPKALSTNAPYIGMLGPRVRAEKIFRELEEDGKAVTDADKERIYAPAGLDIGALSPEEIALSLVGEIRAAFSNRQGGFLRLRQTTIHERN
jgi:xanthine/CO dehydrogenase XdhC/CoxF family maturation factor